VFLFDPKTSALLDLLRGESSKPFEIDDSSAVQSGQRCVVVSNSSLNDFERVGKILNLF
jgi:hypothetical protein